MNAIVTAGGVIQPGEPLYEATHGGRKSMLLIAGKPMVQYVLDALGASEGIERVFVVGLPPETDLVCKHPLYVLPDQGDVISNIRCAAREIRAVDPDAQYAVLASGDLPGLRSEIIDWLLSQAQDMNSDLYYSAVKRETMESTFPKSKRTYLHLKDAQLCGGDLHCFHLKIALEESDFWQKMTNARKSPLRQASMLGYDTLFFLMLRQLSIKDAEETVSKRLGIRGRVLISPYAEIGMDVDKPFQLEIMREYLAQAYEKFAARAG